MGIIKKIFGTKNERELKKLQSLVARINDLEPAFEGKSDSELQGMTAELRQRLANGASLDDLLPEAFATAREASRRVLGMRPFDVQLVGGIVLHSGKIAEMRTGEGKTLTATLPVYLNALSKKGVHVVTVNDYLARRDCEWMSRLYNFLGMDTGVIVHGIEDRIRQAAYRADITYGQNNEFGFDYLRDNMKMSPDRMVQRKLNFAVVDEVDSILIDEARTPLIISGPAEQSADLYTQVDRLIPRLKKDVDYTVDEKAHSTMLTDQGVERVQKLLNLDNLYDPKNLAYVHHVNQALRAHTLYKRDINYLIDDGKIVIIDEFTGRKMPGRRWSDGLHQAIEAKENVEIEEENQTLATITFQNYFRMYEKLSGMTGTADTEATEFHQIYKLDVVVIPTNKPMIRQDHPDLVYKNEKGKLRAVIDEIVDCQKRGQPCLVGTVSVEKSEVISQLLRKQGIKHHVLNAKNHLGEAQIVAQAGRKGAVTISTNMAGRGTDIHLGGNAEAMANELMDAEGRAAEPERHQELLKKFSEQCRAEREEVLAAGGLHILGTERHESRRIDNQLRGRSGRQGDPGSSRFYLSLEDDLLRIFGADRITGLMERLGMEEDVPLEHSWVTKSIENAQKKVEGQHFDTRKHLLEYDDVMNQQRKTIYALRHQILMGRYAPTLSDEDIKAGKQSEVPTTSGGWTVDSLVNEIRPNLENLLSRVLDPPETPADGAELQPRADWRKLRHEVWRQTGAMVDEIEDMFDGAREALLDAIVTRVAESWIQQRERLYDLSDALIGVVLDQHCPANSHSDDWNWDAIEAALRDQFNTAVEVDRSIAELDQLASHIWSQVESRLEEREQELSRPFLLYFQRHFLLEEIDSQWISHLKSMEHLREGIGLRGYGQKDPKKEYKKEGFELFSEMMQNIQVNAGSKICRVQIQRQEAEVPELQRRQRQMNAVHPSADGSSGSSAYGKAADGGASAEQRPKTVRRAEPKIGRNDPCHCGSGKKYKKCHGRLDSDAATA
jgi:preprotein translocase subunit SecA